MSELPIRRQGGLQREPGDPLGAKRRERHGGRGSTGTAMDSDAVQPQCVEHGASIGGRIGHRPASHSIRSSAAGPVIGHQPDTKLADKPFNAFVPQPTIGVP